MIHFMCILLQLFNMHNLEFENFSLRKVNVERAVQPLQLLTNDGNNHAHDVR